MARYKNVGTTSLDPWEHGPGLPGRAADQLIQPGHEFDAILTPEQEAFWLKTGSIVKLAEPIVPIVPVERRGAGHGSEV